MKPSKAEIDRGMTLLRTSGWLATAEPSFREALLAECQWSRVEQGAPVARGGETGSGLIGVAAGEVGIYPVVAAPEAGLIHIDRAAFWFGMQPFISGEGRNITVMARSPCIVAHVPPQPLERLLAAHPVGWQMLLRQVTVLLRITLQAAADLLLPERNRRCAAVLLRISGARDQGQAAHPVHCSHEELGGMCNLSRQTISDVLKDLERQGELELGYRTIRLLDPESLRRFVDDA